MTLGCESALHVVPIVLKELATRSTFSFLFTQHLRENSPESVEQVPQRANMHGVSKAALAFEPVDQFGHTEFSVKIIFSIPRGIRSNQRHHRDRNQSTIKHTLDTFRSRPFQDMNIQQRLPIFKH